MDKYYDSNRIELPDARSNNPGQVSEGSNLNQTRLENNLQKSQETNEATKTQNPNPIENLPFQIPYWE